MGVKTDVKTRGINRAVTHTGGPINKPMPISSSPTLGIKGASTNNQGKSGGLPSIGVGQHGHEGGMKQGK